MKPSSILIDTGNLSRPGEEPTGARRGANGLKPRQITADPFRTFLLVRGSPLDPARPRSTYQSRLTPKRSLVQSQYRPQFRQVGGRFPEAGTGLKIVCHQYTPGLGDRN
jgi:hypothetical protein